MANAPVWLDTIVQPIYDTGFIPTAGAATISFFNAPLGAGTSVWNTSSTKTLADTNLQTASVLPAGYNFEMMGFRLLPPFNMTVVDSQLAFNSAVFVFSIGSKDYLQAPARTIPAGAGAVIAGGATGGLAGLGWPVIDNAFKIGKAKLTLSQVQNFAARLAYPSGVQAVTTTMATGSTQTGCAGLPITAVLDGVLSRLPQ